MRALLEIIKVLRLSLKDQVNHIQDRMHESKNVFLFKHYINLLRKLFLIHFKSSLNHYF